MALPLNSWFFLSHTDSSFFRSVEDDIIVDQIDSPDIMDDFEMGQDEYVDIKDKDSNKQKLRRRIKHCKVFLLLSFVQYDDMETLRHFFCVLYTASSQLMFS